MQFRTKKYAVKAVRQQENEVNATVTTNVGVFFRIKLSVIQPLDQKTKKKDQKGWILSISLILNDLKNTFW